MALVREITNLTPVKGSAELHRRPEGDVGRGQPLDVSHMSEP